MKSNFAISSGSAQSVTINNGKAKTNGVKWDANYNGDVANVDLNLNENGREQHYKVEMTNEELEKIANMFATRSDDEIIDKRLLEDFNENNMGPQMILEINDINSYRQPRRPRLEIQNPVSSSNYLTHISSPTSFEDLIIPFEKPTNYRRRPKTYRVIKVTKKNNSSRGRGIREKIKRTSRGKGKGKGKRKRTSRR
jgi:hypothetical protein